MATGHEIRARGDEAGFENQDLRESPGAIEAVTRAEVDIQIATAKRFPRSPERFIREACGMVSLSPEIAAQCRYKLPARAGGDGKPIEGHSVRLAEIVAACWGNLRVMGRITSDDGKMVTAQGVAMDLERNLAYSVEVPRGVMTRSGRRYSDDQVRTTCLAAIAIATRNAILKAIPRAFVDIVGEHARAIARGDEKTLPARLAAALEWCRNKGVKDAEVFAALGVKGHADVTLDHLETLNGWRTAIRDGDASVATIFRPEPEPKDRREAFQQALGMKTAKPAAEEVDEPGADDDPEQPGGELFK